MAPKIDLNKCRELGRSGPRPLQSGEYSLYGPECAKAYNAGYAEAHPTQAATPAVQPHLDPDQTLQLIQGMDALNAQLDESGLQYNEAKNQLAFNLDQNKFKELVGNVHAADEAIGRGLYDSSVRASAQYDVKRVRALNDIQAQQAFKSVEDRHLAVTARITGLGGLKDALKNWSTAAARANAQPGQPAQPSTPAPYKAPKSLNVAVKPPTTVPQHVQALTGQPYGSKGATFKPGVSPGMYPGAPKRKAITPGMY